MSRCTRCGARLVLGLHGDSWAVAGLGALLGAAWAITAMASR